MSLDEFSDLNFAACTSGASPVTNVTELVQHTLALLEEAYPGALRDWAVVHSDAVVLEVHVGRADVVAHVREVVANVLPAWVELRVLAAEDVQARRSKEGEAELARIGAALEELGRE